MSKAFTSEEAPEVVSAVRAPPRVAPGEVRYVTPEGQAALRAELALLRETTGEPGGLASEQAARLGERTRRIALLEGTLAALTVLDPADAPEGRSGFGTWVTAEDEDGRRSTWRLVGPDEADPRRGAVSVHSPVGRALLDRAVGDEVQVERPGGTRTYRVLAVQRSAGNP
jgi:transcription elongation factor GreB